MSEFPVIDADENVTRQVLADHPDLMVVAFNFNAIGATGALHSHPHVQSTFVETGRFRFTLEGKSFDINAGDSFVIPSNAKHGCECLEPGRLVDCFTPRRDEFL